VHFKADVVDEASRRVVRLAGRLQREHVAELVNVCEQFPAGVRLDLTDLVSLDAPGREALLAIVERGASLEGASPYVALQLEGARPKRVQQSHARRRCITSPTPEPGERPTDKENP
jgi:ABC-type transporter Mla MlaB component